MSSIKNISLYIPHVFVNFDQQFVADKFRSFGEVDHVDLVLKQNKNGDSFHSAYIHFKNWHANSENQKIQAILLSGKEYRHNYNDKWYWLVLENKAKKFVSGDRKLKIDLGEKNVVNTEPEQKQVQEVKLASTCYLNAVKKGLEENTEDMDETEDVDEKIRQEMEEIDACLEEDNLCLITIDGRYVRSLEEENRWLNFELMKLREKFDSLGAAFQA